MNEFEIWRLPDWPADTEIIVGVREWVEGLGLDLERVLRDDLYITQNADTGERTLHYLKFALDEQGNRQYFGDEPIAVRETIVVHDLPEGLD